MSVIGLQCYLDSLCACECACSVSHEKKHLKGTGLGFQIDFLSFPFLPFLSFPFNGQHCRLWVTACELLLHLRCVARRHLAGGGSFSFKFNVFEWRTASTWIGSFLCAACAEQVMCLSGVQWEKGHFKYNYDSGCQLLQSKCAAGLMCAVGEGPLQVQLRCAQRQDLQQLVRRRDHQHRLQLPGPPHRSGNHVILRV